MEQWKTIYQGHVGTRRILVQRNEEAALRALTTLPGTKQKVEISGKTLRQLQQRLVGYNILTEPEATEVAKRIIYH